ncbi:MAG: mobile mystery protein A [Candidatus Omnitrophota bacterium]
MKMKNRGLVIEQLDYKLGQFKILSSIGVPKKGWIRAIRNALNMNCRQFAQRLKLRDRSSVTLLERNEMTGAVTMKTMRHAAQALDCVFVYALVPYSCLKDTIRKQAEKTAKQRTAKTTHTMFLEAQKLTDEEEQKVVSSMVEDLIKNMPKTLWD